MTTRRPKEEEKDPWGLDSGLATDFDMTVVKSRFGFLESYQEGEACLLIMDYESPDVDTEYPIIWPLGKGWETNRDGTQAEHPKRSRFVDTSLMGKLIKRCEEIGASDTLKSKGIPRDATIWEGLSFHMKRETITYPGGAERGIPSSVEHLMPVEFLGPKSGVKAAAAPTRATRRAAPVVQEQEEESALVKKLTSLAKTLTLAQFQKAAMNLDELNEAGNRALLAEVLEDSDSGFWAKAQA